MATALPAPRSHNLPHFIGKNYEIAFKKSIEVLLASPRGSTSSNSRNFAPEFKEFVQSKSDPPLESIWIYAALSSPCSTAPNTDPFSRISAIKDLFQKIVSCSASCNSVKSIALVAPVVFYLHRFALDSKGFQLGAKKQRKVKGEIQTLIDSILGYINVCCNAFDGNYDDLEGLILSLGDLISFWVLNNGVEDKSVESLRVFFPLLSEDIVERAADGCRVIDLAGFVIAEAFLLKLCWKILEDGFKEKAQTELRSWVVGSVTGFRSPYFFVTLVNMMLESALPTAAILNPEHDNDLRKVLFDAFILVEYSFLSPEILGQLPEKLAKSAVFTKLMATHQAIDLSRGHGDHAKAISYSNAFASSTLPSLIIKWVKRECGTDISSGEPKGSSPSSFIKWMLNIENKGIKIFDDNMAKYKAAFNSTEEMNQLASGKIRHIADSNLLFYFDNKGQEDQEEYRTDDDEEEKKNASMSAAFMTAAHSLHSSEKKRRKRKTKHGEANKKIKFIKYFDHSTLSSEQSPQLRSHHSDSGSDEENPSSDKDMID